MSAYGAIVRSKSSDSGPLPSTIWQLKPKPDVSTTYLTIHHLTLSTARAPQEILPGETYSQDQFEAYYFAGDVLIAVLGEIGSLSEKLASEADGKPVQYGIDEARYGRTWEDCIAGCYYVKPNYPGRSSHICNAGFLVPVSQRGKGVGSVLARSFLHYAPRLGYEASVFNLVYVNNLASVRIWESLGFTKAGRIPRAGRLRKANGKGEEFVDAWVFYRRFD